MTSRMKQNSYLWFWFSYYDSAILSDLRIYHNFVRPHQGLPNQMTPAEVAGITVEGDNKWVTLIQAAAKSYYKSAD